MRRREFITLAGAAVVWPFTARAQQTERVRRVGVLMSGSEGDAESRARNTAFLQGLQALGWRVGGNLQIDYRWAPTNVDHSRRNAEELVALSPDVILATGGLL